MILPGGMSAASAVLELFTLSRHWSDSFEPSPAKRAYLGKRYTIEGMRLSQLLSLSLVLMSQCCKGVCSEPISATNCVPKPIANPRKATVSERLAPWLSDCSRRIRRRWLEEKPDFVFPKPVCFSFSIQSGGIVNLQLLSPSVDIETESFARKALLKAAPFRNSALVPYKQPVFVEFSDSNALVKLAGTISGVPLKFRLSHSSPLKRLVLGGLSSPFLDLFGISAMLFSLPQ